MKLKISFDEKFSKSIIDQIELVFIACVLVIIGVFYVIGSHENRKMYLANKEAECRGLSNYLRMKIEEQDNIEWLLAYWKENYETMDIHYDDEVCIREKASEFILLNPGYNARYISEDMLNGLDDYSQKLYAEITYMEMVKYFDDFKRTYHPAFLYFAEPIGDDSVFFHLTGADVNEKRGYNYDEVFPLGASMQIDYAVYPILKETIDTGVEQDVMEATNRADEAGGRHHIWIPVNNHEGKLLGIIGISFSTWVIDKEIDSFMFRNSIVTFVLFFLCGFILLMIVRQGVLVPIIKLKNIVKNYTEEKDSAKTVDAIKEFKRHNDNEIGTLANDISNLALEIDNYTDEVCKLATDKERISAELNLATKIQADMLPSVFPAFPSRKEFDLYAMMDPAKEVGGDFYDFFMVDDDHIALVMADVSGKGVPASLFMVITKTLIKSGARHGKSPAEVLYAVNNRLLEDSDDALFVTVWLAVVEISTGKMVTASAGHEYPVIKGTDGEFAVFKDKRRAPVCTFEDIEYVEEEFVLHPGDRVFVYTDGVPEATDANDELFGMDRMLESLNKRADKSAEEILTGVRADIDAFVKDAAQFDDITMLCFDYFGKVEE